MSNMNVSESIIQIVILLFCCLVTVFLYDFYFSSVVFYMFVVFFSFFFSSIYSLNSKMKFTGSYLLSFVFLFFTLGFRAYSGVDDPTYISIYEQISQIGPWKYFMQTTMEPGYISLNYLWFCLFDDYFSLQVFCSFIPLYLVFIRLKNYKIILNLPLALLLFISLYIFQMLSVSLIRMFIAIAVVFFSLDFLWKKKKRKFLYCILIAASFHYSALIMLLFMPLFSKSFDVKHKWKRVAILIIVFYPILLFFLKFFISAFMGDRYQHYIDDNNTFITYSSFSLMPFFFYALYRKRIIPDQYIKMFMTCVLLLLISTIISLFSSVMQLGRLIYYMNLSIVIIFPMIYRFERKKILKILCFFFMVLYSFLYIYVSQFNLELNSSHLFPYKNYFFTL